MIFPHGHEIHQPRASALVLPQKSTTFHRAPLPWLCVISHFVIIRTHFGCALSRFTGLFGIFRAPLFNQRGVSAPFQRHCSVSSVPQLFRAVVAYSRRQFRSVRSLIFASVTVCQCMFDGLSDRHTPTGQRDPQRNPCGPSDSRFAS